MTGSRRKWDVHKDRYCSWMSHTTFVHSIDHNFNFFFLGWTGKFTSLGRYGRYGVFQRFGCLLSYGGRTEEGPGEGLYGCLQGWAGTRKEEGSHIS